MEENQTVLGRHGRIAIFGGELYILVSSGAYASYSYNKFQNSRVVFIVLVHLKMFLLFEIALSHWKFAEALVENHCSWHLVCLDVFLVFFTQTEEKRQALNAAFSKHNKLMAEAQDGKGLFVNVIIFTLCNR